MGSANVISPDQLSRLWRQHATMLELVARARCAAPEDCVQQAFIRLASQWQTPDDPVAWLVRVVRNLAIDQSRADQRRRSKEREFAAAYAEAIQPPADFSADGLSVEEVAEALNQLDADARELVVAHLWGGLSFRQISGAFGLSSSVAHRRYVAAIERLRQILDVREEIRPARN